MPRQMEELNANAGYCPITIITSILKSPATFKPIKSSLRNSKARYISVDSVRLLVATAANPHSIPVALQRHNHYWSHKHPLI